MFPFFIRLFAMFVLCMTHSDCRPKPHGLSYGYAFDKKPADNLPPAYGFCLRNKKITLLVAKQSLKNPQYRRNPNMYQQNFAQKCQKTKGKYIGGDSGIHQRVATFNLLLNYMPPEEAKKIRQMVYFDTRYHTLRRPDLLCTFESGQCTNEKGYYPGNGHGLRFFKKPTKKK